MNRIAVGEHDNPQGRYIVCPNAPSVAAGQTAVFQLPIGDRYKTILIDASGSGAMSAANFSAIRLIANGYPIQQWKSGSDLDARNQYDGWDSYSTDNVMVLPFERMGANQDGSERFSTCINTGIHCAQSGAPIELWGQPGGINDLRLEIDIASGATTPVLVVTAEVLANNIEQSVALPRVDYVVENVAASTNDNFLTQLMTAATRRDRLREFWHRLIYVDTTAHVTKFRWIENGSEDIQGLTTVINQRLNKSWKLRTPQAGYIMFDWGRDGEAHNLFHAAMCSTLDARVNTGAGAATAPVVYYESMGPLA